tara:strand:- start:233 stop:427 length:195 start_codon:yes stop_codon:yes gene_type:complete
MDGTPALKKNLADLKSEIEQAMNAIEKALEDDPRDTSDPDQHYDLLNAHGALHLANVALDQITE